MTMTDTTPPEAPATEATPVNLNIQDLLDAYSTEVATATRRAVMAEATSAALQRVLATTRAELEQARQIIASQSGDAHTEQEG